MILIDFKVWFYWYCDISPKNKTLPSITHPHVIPNLYEFLFYVEHKRWYFEEFWRTKQLLVLIYFHIAKEILWTSMGTINWLPAFFKIYFMFNRRKKLMQVWNLVENHWLTPVPSKLSCLNDIALKILALQCFRYIHSTVAAVHQKSSPATAS